MIPFAFKKLVSMSGTKLIIVSYADSNWHILVINTSDLRFFQLFTYPQLISLYVSVINHDAVFSVEYNTHNNCQLYLSLWYIVATYIMSDQKYNLKIYFSLRNYPFSRLSQIGLYRLLKV